MFCKMFRITQVRLIPITKTVNKSDQVPLAQTLLNGFIYILQQLNQTTI